MVVMGGLCWAWRVMPDQFAIQLSEREDGTKLVIYLKFVPLPFLDALCAFRAHSIR